MSILFYLKQENNENAIINFQTFLSEFISYSNEKIVIVSESGIDFDLLENHNNITEKLKIFNLYSEDFSTVKSINNYNIKFSPEYLFSIDQTRFTDLKSVPETTNKIVNVLKKIIIENDVKICHFTSIGGVYRSVGMVILQEMLYRGKIKSYMIFSTPIKGRFSIYDNIFFNNKKFEYIYNSFSKNGKKYNDTFDFYVRYLDKKTTLDGRGFLYLTRLGKYMLSKGKINKTIMKNKYPIYLTDCNKVFLEVMSKLDVDPYYAVDCS